MRDKVERILMKYGGLNLWSQQVRSSLIDDLDNELHFSNSNQMSIDSKKEKTVEDDVKNEKSLPNGAQATTQDSPKSNFEKKTSKRGKKISRNKKPSSARRSSKKTRTNSNSDNRNVEEIEMLPKAQQ